MDKPEIGFRIRYYREQRRLTQKQLARAANLAAGTITRYESGEDREPRLYALQAIAAALTIPVTALIEDHPSASNDPDLTPFPSVLSPKEGSLSMSSPIHWETLVAQLTQNVQDLLANERMRLANEQMRIQQVEAKNAQALLLAQENTRLALEEARSEAPLLPHSARSADEPEPDQPHAQA